MHTFEYAIKASMDKNLCLYTINLTWHTLNIPEQEGDQFFFWYIKGGTKIFRDIKGFCTCAADSSILSDPLK